MNSAYVIDPKSPLLFRAGRPSDPAGDPETLAFPLPTTLAGAFRTLYGDASSKPPQNADEWLALRKHLAVHGPLAARIDETGAVDAFFPRPADAVYLKDMQGRPAVYRLAPEPLPDYARHCDLPDGLMPVCVEKAPKAKPVIGDPWWSLKNMLRWLHGGKPTDPPNSLGWRGPARDYRMHVALDPRSLSAVDSKLFQTQGLDFGPVADDTQRGWTGERYALLAHLPENEVQEGFRRIGGEGRLAHILRNDAAWPGIDADLSEKLRGSRFIRLVLVTPALFANGWLPAWLNDDLRGTPPGFEGRIELRLSALANPRWEPVSGWNIAACRPQSVRRMAPSGTVYWFEVIQGGEQIDALWLHPISDGEQNRKDGFGLAIPGVWENIE